MHPSFIVLAAALPTFLAVGAQAFTGSPPGSLTAAAQAQGALLHLARGCHREDQSHYDDALAENVPHFHAGVSCAAIHSGEDKPPIKPHCHRRSEIHYHGEMNRSRWHQHSKMDCSPFLVDAVEAPNRKQCYDRGRVRVCR